MRSCIVLNVSSFGGVGEKNKKDQNCLYAQQPSAALWGKIIVLWYHPHASFVVQYLGDFGD